MTWCKLAMAGAIGLVVVVSGVNNQAEARIRCEGPFQIIPGEGHIASPYCEIDYLAEVARGYGMRVSASQLRRSMSQREEVCRTIGHDGRVESFCQRYRNDGDRGGKWD